MSHKISSAAVCTLRTEAPPASRRSCPVSASQRTSINLVGRAAFDPQQTCTTPGSELSAGSGAHLDRSDTPAKPGMHAPLHHVAATIAIVGIVVAVVVVRITVIAIVVVRVA
jgi:hypothetical protein